MGGKNAYCLYLQDISYQCLRLRRNTYVTPSPQLCRFFLFLTLCLLMVLPRIQLFRLQRHPEVHAHLPSFIPRQISILNLSFLSTLISPCAFPAFTCCPSLQPILHTVARVNFRTTDSDVFPEASGHFPISQN